MAFKASKMKKGLFEVHGIEAFIVNTIGRLLGHKPAAPAKAAPKKATRVKAAPAKKAAAKKTSSAAASKAATAAALPQLVSALNKHPKKGALIKAGKTHNDQLLRSLIPLYLAQKLGVEVTSGTTSQFWGSQGVKYLAPNAAKALREHVGYARQTKTGRQITPNGVKYVEAALAA